MIASCTFVMYYSIAVKRQCFFYQYYKGNKIYFDVCRLYFRKNLTLIKGGVENKTDVKYNGMYIKTSGEMTKR